MRRALVRSFSLLSLPNCNDKIAPLANSARSVLRSYSSSDSNGSPGEPNTAHSPTQNPDVIVDDNDDCVSSEGLKRKIEEFYEGDEEALPSIFESILKRKLAGISDDELMEGLNLPVNHIEDAESDSELDEVFDSDEEIDDDDDDDELYETNEENGKG